MSVQKPVDLIIVDAKTDIIDRLNQTGLPLVVMSMIAAEVANLINAQVKDVIPEVRKRYDEQVAAETAEETKKTEETK